MALGLLFLTFRTSCRASSPSGEVECAVAGGVTDVGCEDRNFPWGKPAVGCVECVDGGCAHQGWSGLGLWRGEGPIVDTRYTDNGHLRGAYGHPDESVVTESLVASLKLYDARSPPQMLSPEAGQSSIGNAEPLMLPLPV